MRQITILLSLLCWAGVSQGAQEASWVTRGFEEFSKGTFDSAGANLYVSAGGRVQMIRTWDVNNDGNIDLVFGNSHDLVEYEPARVYFQKNGKPCPETLLLLPTHHSTSQCVADLNNDGYTDVIILNYMWTPNPVTKSFIYWGGPEGLTPKYRTSISTFNAKQAFAEDLNADGLKEIIVINHARERLDLKGSCISIYWQSEAGLFPIERREDIVVPSLGWADMADINGDGFAEMVFQGQPSKDDLGSAAMPVLKAIGSSKDAENVFLLAGQKGGFGPIQALAITGERSGRPRLLKINGAYHLAMLSKKTLDLYPFSGLGVSKPKKIKLASKQRQVAVADLNTDGFDDLICVGSGQIEGPYAVQTGTIQILWGSDIGYDPKRALDLPIQATNIAVGDFTDDGLADLAVAVYAQGKSYAAQSRLYINSKNGLDKDRFIALETSGASEVHIADLNHDGKNDISFACSIGGHSSLDPPVRVYLGSNDGTYEFGRHYDLPAESAYGGFLADYNDDGFTDLLVTNQYEGTPVLEGQRSSIYWGDQDGLSADRFTAFPTEHACTPMVADINRDGYLDVVMGAVQGGTTYLYWGSKSGFSADSREPIKLGDLWGIHLADVDKDGWLDLIYPAIQHENVTYILKGDKNGFDVNRKIALHMPLSGAGVETADLDGNGWLDLVVTGWSNPRKGLVGTDVPSFIWWGCEQGYSPARRTEFILQGADHAVAIADLNKDGHLDLVCSNYDQGIERIFDAYIFWGNPQNIYSKDNRTRLRQAASLGIMVADFNHDGWPDISFCNHNPGGDHNTISRVHWNRQGKFTDSDVTLLPTTGPHGAIASDLGNAYTRKLEETYTSAVFERAANQRFGKLSWQAQNKFGTSVVFQVRTAPTGQGLDDAVWRGADGEGSYFTEPGASLEMLPAEHSWIQYRAVLRTPDGAATAILTEVEITLKPAN